MGYNRSGSMRVIGASETQASFWEKGYGIFWLCFKYQSSCSAIVDSVNTSIGVDVKARGIPVPQHTDRSKLIAILSNYTKLSSFPVVNMKELGTASLWVRY